jgi:hypothetical protein
VYLHIKKENVKGKKTVERTQEKTEWWYIWEPSQPQIRRLGAGISLFSIKPFPHTYITNILPPEIRHNNGGQEERMP